MKNSKPVDMTDFQHLYPFESNYMDLGELKYHYVDEGIGDPVVMLHGNPTWSFYYRDLINALSSEYRTIAPDHIGCGLSDKPNANEYEYRLQNRVDDLDQFLTGLDIKNNITLVLHDWGGMIGVAYALRHIQRIRRLVILNTAAFPPPDGKPIPFRLKMIRNLSPFATPAVLGLNLFAVAASYMATYKGLSKSARKGLVAPYNCWRNRLATLKFVQDIPLKAADPSYALMANTGLNIKKLSDIPILICWGEHDFVFDMAYFKEWRRRFPRAEAHSFPDAGHYILEDAADQVIPLVKDFLKRNPI